jgi:hypothetical protein
MILTFPTEAAAEGFQFIFITTDPLFLRTYSTVQYCKTLETAVALLLRSLGKNSTNHQSLGALTVPGTIL